MESTLKNMVLTLFVITLVAAATLGGVYSLTKEPIAVSKQLKTVNAIGGVLPEFDNNPAEDTVGIVIDNMPIKVYIGKKNGTPTGYAVESMTKQGFSGEIRMMVGFTADGEINNIEVLQHNETPGLGSKMTDKDNPLILSFRGKNPAELDMRVKKDGGNIDVITASTISSRAYADAVKRAFEAYRRVAQGEAAPEIKDPIDRILPGHDNSPLEYPSIVEIDGRSVNVYTGLNGGDITGYAAEGIAKGYDGGVTLLVGFKPDGEIVDIVVAEFGDSPHVKGRLEAADNPLTASFIGKKVYDLNMALKPDGDIDGLSGATVTSAAYVEAVSNAYKALEQIKVEDKNHE